MATRMEKYGNNITSDANRSLRNKDLYDVTYDETNYSNIEGIVSTPTPNEVDIEKIKEIMDRKEEEKRKRTQLIRSDIDIELPESDLFELDKKYDIRDVLTKAKEDKIETREHRKLKNTEYDILKSLQIKNSELESSDAEKELSELKELMYTLTSKHDFKNLGNTELSLHLLDDLKSDTEASESIKALIEDAKKEEDELNKEEIIDMDKSFYTNSSKFKVKDFTDAKKEIEKNSKTNAVMKWILAVNFILLLVIVSYILYSIFK